MVDLGLIILILVFALVGYGNGLIKVLVTLTGSIVALIMSFIVYPVVNMILKATAIYTIIYNGVFTKLQGIDFGKGIQTQGKAITENITWLPKFLTEQIASNNNTPMYELLGVHTLVEYISTYITDMIIGMLAILITWFAIKVVLVGILRSAGKIVEHLPIISGLNHFGGFIVGIFKGIFTICIITLIVPAFLTMPSLADLGMLLQSSYLVRWFYEHNLVIWIYHSLID